MDLRTKESLGRRAVPVTLGINSRILAIELRYRRFGFAAMEVPKELLDAGVRTFRSAVQAPEVLQPIIRLFTPSVIVIKTADHNDKRYRAGMSAIMRRIRNEAVGWSIPVDHVTTNWVRDALGGNVKNKGHVADLVARIYPSLGWRLPPTREHKPWLSEGWNMPIFDAIAIGLAYFENSPVDIPST